MTERVKRVRRKKIKRRNKRLRRVMLSVGIAGVALGAVLVLAGYLQDSPKLLRYAAVYVLSSAMILSVHQVQERVHQIRKRKYTYR